LIAKGAYLFPNDVHASQAYSVTNIQLANGQDALLNAQYLRITFGSLCSTNPSSKRYCLVSRPELDATECKLYNFPRGYDPAGQALINATDFTGVSDLPEIRCIAPAGSGAQRDINIYWHGIALSLPAWWHYSAPKISSVSPSSVTYSGGSHITIFGSNFGPFESWTVRNVGGFKNKASVKTLVEIVGRRSVQCQDTTWVSDSQLICVVPPLPMTKQAVDIVQHTVPVQVCGNPCACCIAMLMTFLHWQVVVVVDEQASTQGPSSNLLYSGVPAYFACDNTPGTLSKESCFTCCRSSCIVDSFAQGGAQGTATMGNCDNSCYSYCEF
jgi:hypothetical protein